MKVLVSVKRVIDYNVKARVKADQTGVDLATPDFAMVATHHFAPTREGTLYEWAELSTLVVRDCTVRNMAVLIIATGKNAPKNQQH